VSTVVSAIVARVVAGVHTASTVVSAMFARSAVGQESASMVVSAEDARSAGRTNDDGGNVSSCILD
jgi:hypothetical protein